MTEMNAEELEAAIDELIAETIANATYYQQASGWVTDVHGVTPDVETVEAAADDLKQRLGE